jgi:hypothetical protein
MTSARPDKEELLARARRPSEDALRLHPFYRGKIQTALKCPIRDFRDFPLCLRTKDPDEVIRTVELLEPAFGAINLEDIAQPKCFRILDTLRAREESHDDG